MVEFWLIGRAVVKPYAKCGLRVALLALVNKMCELFLIQERTAANARRVIDYYRRRFGWRRQLDLLTGARS